MRTCDVEAEQIVLELTETFLVKDPEIAVLRLEELRDLGVGVAVDDFGTGYSSLAYLRQFPLDSLKIDKSFVKNLGEPGEDTSVVAAMIALGHALGHRVTAEGVETAEQMATLSHLGCDEAQGYYFARPLTLAEAEAIVREPQLVPAPCAACRPRLTCSVTAATSPPGRLVWWEGARCPIPRPSFLRSPSSSAPRSAIRSHSGSGPREQCWRSSPAGPCCSSSDARCSHRGSRRGPEAGAAPMPRAALQRMGDTARRPCTRAGWRRSGRADGTPTRRPLGSRRRGPRDRRLPRGGARRGARAWCDRCLNVLVERDAHRHVVGRLTVDSVLASAPASPVNRAANWVHRTLGRGAQVLPLRTAQRSTSGSSSVTGEASTLRPRRGSRLRG